MKNLKGGLLDGGGVGCATTIYCGKWVGGSPGHWEAGTCSMEPGLPGLPPLCICSTGGSDGCSTS